MMYHINNNLPPPGSKFAHSKGASDLYAAPMALKFTKTSSPATIRRHGMARDALEEVVICPAPQREQEALLQYRLDKFTLAVWGPYQTLTHMRSSPYYMRIDLPSIVKMEGRNKQMSDADDTRTQQAASRTHKNFLNTENGSADIRSHVVMHVVHPIPVHYLQSLAPHQLAFLYGYLVGKRFRSDGELSRRVERTLDTIGQVMALQ
jgi:hypothetical protein